MKYQRKTSKTALFIGAAACCAFLALLKPVDVSAEENKAAELTITAPVRVSGTISREGERLMLKDIQGDTSLDMLVLNTSEQTRILDAVNGFPVPAGSLKEGETVYAYISPAMALSMPPQSYAEMIICQIPAGFAAPSYETVSKISGDNDTGWRLTTNRGMNYGIDNETALLPYLTRNIVTTDSLTPGTSCLVWPDRNMTDSQGNEIIHASKVVIFAGGGTFGGGAISSGPASDPSLTEKIELQ